MSFVALRESGESQSAGGPSPTAVALSARATRISDGINPFDDGGHMPADVQNITITKNSEPPTFLDSFHITYFSNGRQRYCDFDHHS